jgi:peptide chain release factor 1
VGRQLSTAGRPVAWPIVLERLDGIEAEYQAVEVQLGDPAVLADPARLMAVGRRYKELGPLVAVVRRHRARTDDLAAARELLAMAEGDEREMLRGEVDAAEAELAALEEEARLLLLPKDPNDGRAVIVEIRGAEGGEEANLFARDLFEMYRAYAARRGWPLEVLSVDLSALDGFNEITFTLRGADAWSRLKYEGGPHRVQRVPVTESQGRIHTSSATVLVLPEAEEVDVEIDAGDLVVDTYRASSAGGQHVNTTDSAVRITHKPSGLVVTMQDERSQLQNRARAMVVLRSRLLKLQQDRVAAEQAVERRAQVGGGGRSEKIRTYNFKENRVTDHRIGLTIHQLDAILGGDLDALVDALAADERRRQLEVASA